MTAFKLILEAASQPCKEQTAGGCWVHPCSICNSAATSRRESGSAVDVQGRGQRCFRQLSTSHLVCNICCLCSDFSTGPLLPLQIGSVFHRESKKASATMSSRQVSKQICLKVPGLVVISWGGREERERGKNQDKKTCLAGILHCDYSGFYCMNSQDSRSVFTSSLSVVNNMPFNKARRKCSLFQAVTNIFILVHGLEDQQ